jgi:hypothetical protein
MKKLTLLLVLIGLAFSNLAIAGAGDLFQYDKEKINQEMQDLNQLENLLVQNQDLSYADLLAAENPLVMNMDLNAEMALPGMINGPIIPAFWWGCILGPVGVLIVYIVEDDRAQTKSAFWGCVISTLLWGSSSWYWWFRSL